MGAGRRLERPPDVGDLGGVARGEHARRLDAPLGDRRPPRPRRTSTSGCRAAASSRAPTAAPTGRRSTRASRPTSCPSPTPSYGHDPHCVRLHPADPDRLYQQNHCGIYRLDRPRTRGSASATTCRPTSATSASRSSCTRATPTPPGCSRWTAPTCGRAPAPTAARRRTSPATPARRGPASTTACRSTAWFTVKRQAMTADDGRPGRRLLRHDQRRGVGQRRRGRARGRASLEPPARDLLRRVRPARRVMQVRIPTPLRSYTGEQSDVERRGHDGRRAPGRPRPAVPRAPLPGGRRAGPAAAST